MLKVDVFLWLTVKCYGEVSTKRYRQKDIDKLKKKCQANESTKRFIYGGKKGNMEQRETN